MQTRKQAVTIMIIIIFTLLIGFFGFLWGQSSSYSSGQMSVWDNIAKGESDLRNIYSNSTQLQLKEWLPDGNMNFTDGLIWESKLLHFNMDRPLYENVTQVLKNGKGACGEHVWVYTAFCVAKGISFRVVTVGYLVPSVVDHSWIQVNPSGDGKTWVQVDVSDSCVGLQNGKTIDQLWNVTINNNDYYVDSHYKMVLAYQLNENNEVVVTDVTSTFSPLTTSAF